MPVTVEGTLTGLDLLLGRIEVAMPDLVGAVAKTVEVLAAEKAPRGHAGNTTNPSGDMAMHMTHNTIRGGGDRFETTVGSDVQSIRPGRSAVWNYSRQREFGGHLPQTLTGAILRFRWPRAVTPQNPTGWTFARSVNQVGSHFLLRTREEAGPFIEAVVTEELTKVMEGA